MEISNIYFLLYYYQFSSEFHFVLRLLVSSASFTLEYANTSTSWHNDLKAMATNQVGFRRNNHDVEVFRLCQWLGKNRIESHSTYFEPVPSGYLFRSSTSDLLVWLVGDKTIQLGWFVDWNVQWEEYWFAII